MIRMYRKKPVVIEAIRWENGNESEITQWCGGRHRREPRPGDPTDVFQCIEIPTLEGIMRAGVGDWIVRGVHGEFYPVKDAIFRETYEAERADADA